MLKLDGIFPPLPTSFDNSENLVLNEMQSNIRKLSKYNLSGFLVLGSNGEMVNLNEKEKTTVYEMARDAIPSNKLMIAGTGGQSTKETIALTRSAANEGTDAVLVLNPSYYKGLMSTASLVSHYFSVAEASPVPVIIYNMPTSTGLDMNADTIVDIARHPNIIGMKDSGGNVVKMGDIKFRVHPEFQILAGSAGFLLPALSIGAIGGILALANIAPNQCIGIYEAFINGDLNKARKIQLEMIPVNTAVTSKWGIPALKEAMDHLGLYGGPTRKPILPVTPEVSSQLLNLINSNTSYHCHRKHNINSRDFLMKKELIIKWVEIFNRRNADEIALLYHNDAINHQVTNKPIIGKEAIKKMFKDEFSKAEMTCIIENIFEDGDWVILEWKDPLGLRGCGFFHVIDGKIKFQRGYWDKLSFLRQHNLPFPINSPKA